MAWKHQINVLTTSMGTEEVVVPQTGLVLLKFSKKGCAPCAMLRSALDKVAAVDTIARRVVLLNVELENVGERAFHAHGVRQTPTLIVMLNGAVFAKLPGFTPPDVIASTLRSVAASTVNNPVD